jgi:AhpD family alkylhydroperoxidase
MHDLDRILMHRWEFFGAPFVAYTKAAIGDDHQTPTMHLLGAHVSRLNSCQLCAASHSAAAVRDSAPDQEAAAPPALLELLECLTAKPDQVSPAIVDEAVAKGLEPDLVARALHVGVAFNLVNRVANTLGAEPLTAAQLERYSRRTAKAGPDV